MQSMTLSTAMNQGTNLRTLSREYKETPEVLSTAVFNLLDYCRAALMLDNTNDQQLCLMSVSMQIIEADENACFTLEEIMYCLQKGINGKYGKSFHKLSAETINQWLDNLYVEKMTVVMTEHEIKKNSSGNASDRVSTQNSPEAEFQKLIDDRAEQKIKTYKRNLATKYQRDQAERDEL